MKKADAEKAIRSAFSEWLKAHPDRNIHKPGYYSSFIDFHKWLQEIHPQYLKFRSTTPVPDLVEMWFDDEVSKKRRSVQKT